MRKILLNRGRWGIVLSRYQGTILGVLVNWDYYSIIATVNVLTFELTVEFVHDGLHKTRWEKRGFGLHLDINY